MKFKVYNEKEAEKVTRLVLKESHYGGVNLVAVDEKGNRLDHGLILIITKDGTISRYEDVSDSLGFKLDCKGRVLVE